MIPMADTYLALTWGVSRGQETYGYNIRRLRDQSTGQTFRCMGGGYDMTGTVLADWAEATHQDKLMTMAWRAFYAARPGEPLERCENVLPPNVETVSEEYDPALVTFYGMTRHENAAGEPVRVTIDGGCGIESVRRILDAIGVLTRSTVNRRGNVTGYLVTVVTDPGVES